MQTFLPYPDFAKSARCLDWKRLGKQRVEAWQILNTLRDGSKWENHPAVLMWKGYEDALISYTIEIIVEWKERGYNDTMLDRLLAERNTLNPEMPPWLGDDDFHSSHRANLLRKDSEHYGEFGWQEDSSLPYVWPVRKESR